LLQSVFLNPKSIFFVPFLVSGIFITLFWLKVSERKSLKQSLKLLFAPEVWLTRQAAIDLSFSFLILVVVSKGLVPLESFIFSAIGPIETFLGAPATRIFTLNLSPNVESILVTLIAMLAYDFASYFTHRWMHTNPVLWRIHAFHHSAETLTFFTTYRQHLLEPVLLTVTRTSAVVLSLVLFHYFFATNAHVITVIGLGLGFFIYMFTVNLHHSPIPVRYPHFLRKILVSPHVHHLHHSADALYSGKNYGVIFSFWDIWFKTYADLHSEQNHHKRPQFYLKYQ